MRTEFGLLTPFFLSHPEFSRRVNDIFGEAFNRNNQEQERGQYAPACEIEETDDHYLVSLDVPGISKEAIKIEVNGDQLLVSGERKWQDESKRSRHFSEKRYGRFQRLLTLPAQVDTTKIEAQYRDGVLEIAIPKSEAVKPRQIKISDSRDETGFLSRFRGQSVDTKSVSSEKEHAA